MSHGYRFVTLVVDDLLGPIYDTRDLGAERYSALVVRGEYDRDAVLAWAARLARMPPHPRVQHRVDLVDRDPIVVVLRTISERVIGPRSSRALEHLTQVAQGLAHAHRHGVVHGNLTGDVVVPVGDEAFVTRFGTTWLARSLNPTRAGGYVARDAHAVAPELWAAGATPTEASDVYALGVLAYEWLAGRVPFAAHDSLGAIAQATLSEAPPPLEGDREVAAVVRDMLAKDPAGRPSASQVAIRLDPALEWPLI